MSLPERTKATQTNVTGTGSVVIISASGDPIVARDLVSLVITTINAVASVVTISDGTSGKIILNYPNAASAPSAPVVISFGDVPLPQDVPNLAWQMSASVNASGYNVTAHYRDRQ